MKNRCFTGGPFGYSVLRAHSFLLVVMISVLAVSGFAQTREREQPRSFSLNDKSQEQVQRKALPKVNTERLLAEDQARGKNAQRPGPRRFAVAVDVNYTLENSGTWQTLTDGRLWRLRIQSPGATSHNLGITRFDLPEGAKLWIYDPAHKHVEGPYTSRNRSHAGSLWTPVIEGEEIVVEVFVPTGVSQPGIGIRKVNQGYTGFEKAIPGGGTEGTCEIDVICSQGDPWRDQIRAVGAYTVSGTATCTGTMLNDIPHDFKPYFLSANHCGVNSSNDDTVVVYWNYQAASCNNGGAHGAGSTTDNQSGSTFRASYAPSDFLLFELSAVPDAGFHVFYAGWDAGGAAPAAIVAIHHPNVDVKAISFSNTVAQSANWTGTGDGGVLSATGNHWRIDWDAGAGVTEPGSSGSCIFDITNGRCVGQLHGGPSSCGASSANLHDYYGKFSASWNGGGTSSTRLKDWLDPGNTGAITNEGDPHINTASGIHYDFQGAGEYVSLRKAGGLEIQTRQAPIATTFNPGPDPHDGLATCVSLNTAVAARVGTRRVTYEPNLNGVPDPSGLQLRVDGALTTLGAGGLDLGNGGRISKTSDSGGIEVDFPDGTVMFVTPNWWPSQSKWYLNVDVLGTPAADGAGGGGITGITAAGPTSVHAPAVGGIMGEIPSGSWLPVLPDGTSMGPMPASIHQRYLDLYQKFGEAWRVTNADSLFDYASGTTTATFTMSSWPPENSPCTIAGVTPVDPANPSVAEQACSQVTGANRHADCVFDVRVTGNTGFATTYLGSQHVIQTGGTVGTNGTGGNTGNGGNIGNGGNNGTGGNNSPFNGKWAVFLDAGANFPHGNFSGAFDTGFSFNAGLEYMVNPHFSAEGIFGYHRFRVLGGSVNLFQFSANAKTYLTAPPNKLRPFLNGGVGVYTFTSGTTRFGGNIGGGLLYEVTPKFGVQGSYNLHLINIPGNAFKFSTVQGGVRFVF